MQQVPIPLWILQRHGHCHALSKLLGIHHCTCSTSEATVVLRLICKRIFSVFCVLKQECNMSTTEPAVHCWTATVSEGTEGTVVRKREPCHSTLHWQPQL